MEITGITVSETDGDVYLRSQPTSNRPAVDAAALNALLVPWREQGCELDEEAIASAAEQCNTRPEPFVIRVGARCDAQVDVSTTADDMLAQVVLTPARGGKALTAEDLMQSLAASGVVFGIDPDAVLQACQATRSSTLSIARGVLPQDGTDAVFEELISHVADRSPKVDATGHIDYREHGSIQVVAAGTPLMRRHPATPGVDGQTVRGRTLPARPGIDEPFGLMLAGTQCAAADPNTLEAAVSGQPVLAMCGMTVEPILRVAEVNMAVGNIHFDGSVEVQGDVVQGMLVQAKGDIVVQGMVDGGVLEAGGDILVAGGVIAHAKLHAGGSVSARFAQGVQIHAGTVLSLADMALDCELQSLNQIEIGANAPGRGRLVGGTTTAMMLLKVPLLGSAKGVATKVVMGINTELTRRLAELEIRVAKEKAAEEALEKLIKQISAAKDPKGMLPRIRASQQHAMQVWGQSLAEKKALEEEIALGFTAIVHVGAAVEGTVDLVFGHHPVRLRREFPGGVFSLDPVEHVLMFQDAMGRVVKVE